MNKLFIILFLIFGGIAAYAQPSRDFFNFQGVARDAAGKVITNKSISVRFSVLPFFQTYTYRESHKVTTNAHGIFNVLVGTGTPIVGSFETVNWDQTTIYLQVDIDPEGGEDYIAAGGTQLVSVPYALHSRRADSWKQNEPIIQIGGGTVGATLPAVGDGNRLIWYPKKGAFLAGINDGNIWRDENIGQGSAALGLSPIATGSFSAAFGTYTKATGVSSLSGGEFSEAKGKNTLAFGNVTIAEGDNSVTLGDHAIAFGQNSLSSGLAAEIHGDASVAIGQNVIGKAFGSAVFGAYNNVQENPFGGKFEQRHSTDRIFQIGNSNGPTELSNALTILRNGNIGVGNGALIPEFSLDIATRPRIRHNTETGETAGLFFNNSESKPKGFVGMKNDNEIGFYLADTWRFYVRGTGGAELIGGLTQVSDKRLKRDFAALSGSIQKISQLNGYHYYWKDKGLEQTLQTGFIAQEVEALFPELVTTSATGVKAVNYVALIPHLVESIKALKNENNQLKEVVSRVDDLEENMNALLRMVSKNASRAERSK